MNTSVQAGHKARRLLGVLTATVFLTLVLAGCGAKRIEQGNAQAQKGHSPFDALTDSRDGKKYRTVKIGELTWMAENLNFETENSSCYEDNASHCEKYGRLYTQDAMSVCPDGWHLPDNDDWDNLFEVAGGKEIAGKKLKTKTGWGGTDDFGFSAMPGGNRCYDGFIGSGEAGSWWSATITVMTPFAYKSVQCMTNEDGVSQDYSGGDDLGANRHSVRCVMVDTPLLTVVPNRTVGGAVTPLAASRRNANTPVTITATAGAGYKFVNWTVGEGQERRLRIADPDSATTTVTLNMHAKVIANFHLQRGAQFNSRIKYSTFTDSRNDKEYRTVKIGNNTWMAENLDGSQCYEHNGNHCEAYGGLYELDDATNVCPDGWRLPDDDDWNDLVKAAGGEKAAGKKLKSKTGWDDRKDGSAGGGTDDFGFSAIPGGALLCDSEGGFYANEGGSGHWWSATKGEDNIYYWSIDLNSGVVRQSEDISCSNNHSVRCVRIEEE